MDTQRQCPNPYCGGYKIIEKQSSDVGSDFITEDVKSFTRNNGIVTFILLAIIAYSAITAFASGVADFLKPPSIPLLIISSIALPIFLLIRINSRKWAKYKNLYTEAKARQPINYECQICGKRWTWNTSEPYPYPPGSIHYTPNPSLISAGEKRLADEERQRQITAMAYYDQQRKRNNK